MTRGALKGAIIGIAIGAAVGVGGFTFIYAKGGSYFSNDPAACANCHVMQNHLDRWVKSSHRAVAVCNDCHAPHNFIGKYLTKADNGFWHSLKFTTGDFPDNLHMRPSNVRVTEASCLHCHQQIVDAMTPHPHTKENITSCMRCHAGVGHAR